MNEHVTSQVHGGVHHITLDDGKANALSNEVLDALDAALSFAEEKKQALLLIGRPGRFSAGFNLQTMMSGPEPARALVARGARFMMRLWLAPIPVVAACTGHAVAGGALLLLCCDRRVAAEGPFKIGLNEVSIGMRLPAFAAELARFRLLPTQLGAATLESRMFTPAEAAEVGFVDGVAAPEALVERAHAEAVRLAALQRHAFAGTKRILREATAARVLDTLDADLHRI